MLDPKEERKYKRLRKLAQELHIPIPEAFWELEVRDKDGKVIQRLRQRSHSWTRNAYNLMFAQLAGKDLDDSSFGAGYLSLKNTGNYVMYGDAPTIASGSGAYSWDGTSYGYRSPAGNDTHGILVGSGTNPESFEDYTLQSKIANGTGTGELSYVESDPHAITWTAGTLTMKNELTRYFNNNSGGDVDVNEVALVAFGYSVGKTAYTQYVMSRDKLASTVTVPDTGQLKVTYTIQLTYPV